MTFPAGTNVTPAPAPVFEVERWTSDNAEEVHLFLLRGDARGSAYVLGYNPKLIGHGEVLRFLDERGFRVAADTLHEAVLPGVER